MYVNIVMLKALSLNLMFIYAYYQWQIYNIHTMYEGGSGTSGDDVMVMISFGILQETRSFPIGTIEQTKIKEIKWKL